MNFLKFGNSNKFIVFLHGWGSSKEAFLWLKDYYYDYSLVFVDFDGFGESPEPERPFFVSDYVDKLYKVLSEFQIEELVFVAHSFGGRVAIKYAFLYHDYYKNVKLCLVDAAGMKPRRGVRYLLKVFRYKKLKKRAIKNPKLVKKLSKYGSSDYKKLSSLMKQTFVNVVNENLEVFAREIKLQTLIIWGSDDCETKIYMAKRLNRLIKNSKLEIIKDAGHFSFIDKPYEFLFLLDTFVKN